MDNYIIIDNEAGKARKKLFIIGGISLFLVIAVMAIVLIVLNIKPRYEHLIKVEGYDELDVSIPLFTRENFGAQLYYLLNNNFELSEDLSEEVAMIRAGSLNKNMDGEIKIASFIVDIDSLQQTYWVVLNWSDIVETPEDVSIECVGREEAKYPSAQCYGMTTTSDSIEIYLPDVITVPTGQEVKLEYGLTTSEGQDIVKVTVGSCGDEVLEKSALSSAESWVRLQGIDPNNIVFKLNSVYENCLIKGGD